MPNSVSGDLSDDESESDNDSQEEATTEEAPSSGDDVNEHDGKP